ncbi:MAG: hypothetical protein JNG88_11560, partial [Phycisphaerales bacterium]|nr:hypothetical protein [Phycisphaerales bacterium]
MRISRFAAAISAAMMAAGVVLPASFGQQPQRQPVTFGDDEGGVAGGGIVAFISGTTLTILGSTLDDSVRLVINGGDPNQLDIYSPYNAGTPSLFFALSSFNNIVIQLDDGNDLLVLDEANGSIIAQKPTTIDGGEGQDDILTATAGLPVPTVLSLLNTLDSARALLTQTNDILTVVGANGTPGTSPGMIRDAGLAANSAYVTVIDPTAQFFRDLPDDLIRPATDEVLAAYNGSMTDSLRLVEQAYNDIIVVAQALAGDVESDLVPQAEALSVAADDLKTHADAVFSCGSALETEADAFLARLDDLRNRIDALSQICPEDAPEPAEPPDGPDTCPQIQELLDCIELEAELFQAMVEICEADGDDLSDEADALDDQGTALDALADQYEARADALELLADTYTALVDQYELDQEAWAAGLDSLMDSTTAAILARAQTDIEAAATALESSVDASLRAAADDVASRAATFTSDVQNLMDQAAALLGSSLLPGGGSCSSIVTTSTVNGGGGNDTIYSSGAWEIFGGLGDDTIVGSASDEKLHGDAGDDVIYGGDGTNEIHGGIGNDSLYGGTGTDCIYGGANADVIWGYDGNDTIEGNDGIDVIFCGAGDDRANGNDGIDVILGEAGLDKLAGDDGVDVILGGTDADEITGDDGQTISFSGFSLDLGDLLFGNGGDDDIHGDDSGDTGDGFDVIFGGDGIDTIHGANGGDLTIGSFTIKLGHLMFGGNGDDSITALDGIDAAWGGAGDDTITLGIGDTLVIGSFELQLGDVAFGGPGNDTIHGDDPNAVDDTNDPNDYLTDIDALFGGPGNDTIHCYSGGTLKIGSSFEMTIGNFAFGAAGIDTIDAEDGVDVLFGGTENDTIEAQDGSEIDFGSGYEVHMGDFLIGGTGDDELHGDRPTEPTSSPTDDGFDVILGNAGDDGLYGGRGGEMQFTTSVQFKMGTLAIGGPDNDTIYGDYLNFDPSDRKDGIDIVIAGAGNDYVDIGPGDNLQIGSGSNQITIDFGGLVIGHTGSDTILGGKDMDIIIAGAQNDSVQGFNGIDFVLGGLDQDTIFVHDGGYITIPINGTPVPIPLGNIVLAGDHNDYVDSDGLPIEIDLLLGNKCDDEIYAGNGLIDIVIGGRGRDEIHGQNGIIDLLIGGRGNDEIYCEPSIVPNINIAFGALGDDYIVGSSDLLSTDVLFGNRNDDLIYTGDGLLNLALGGQDQDEIHGGGGLDILMGGNAGDQIYGNGGPLNLMLGGLHDDCIDPQNGLVDIALGGFGNDFILGGNVLDVLAGNFGDDTIITNDGVNVALGGFDNDYIEGGTLVDVLLGGFGDDAIKGASGFDVIMGGFGGDAITGNDQIDVILGGFGPDNIDGGDNTDILLGGFDSDVIYGGNSFDVVFGSYGPDDLDGNDGNDIMLGSFDSDRLIGRGGSDLEVGGWGGDQVFSGPDGNRDLLLGGFGNDTLNGYKNVSGCSCCSHNDFFYGGLGSDTKCKGCCGDFTFARPSVNKISGTVYMDYNNDTVGDAPLGGIIVYLDLNNDGVRQGGEPAVTTPMVDNPNTCINEIGYFVFSGLGSGTFNVRQDLSGTLQQTYPVANAANVVSLGIVDQRRGLVFANYAYCHALPDGSCGPCECPPGYECLPYATGTFFECVDGKPCDEDDDCPCGLGCQPVNRVIEYRCQPIQNQCQLVDGPGGFRCVGLCPQGLTCTLFYDASQNPFCECVQGPSCQLIDDPNHPSGFGCRGFCNDGTACVLVPSPVAPGWDCVCNGGGGVYMPELPTMTCDVRTFGQDPMNPSNEPVTPQGDAEMRQRFPRGNMPPPNTPQVPPPPHNALKNRYISFVPNNGNVPVAFEVVIPPCRRGWVGPPRSVSFNGRDQAFVCDVVPVPVYRVWGEPVLHVRGCVIAPERSYDLIAHNQAGGFSSPLTLQTVSKWGDVVGVPLGGGQWSPPDGILNVFDRQAVQQKAAGALFPHTTWADL